MQLMFKILEHLPYSYTFQVYVDMQKIDRYPHKIEELYEVIKKKASVEGKVCS